MANHQLAIILVLFALAGCTKPPTAIRTDAESEAFSNKLMNWQLKKTQAASNGTTKLVNVTRRSMGSIDPEQRKQWQSAWSEAHDLWLAAAFLNSRDTRAYRNIDAWPIAPGFIDSLPEYPTSGIVNDLTLQLTSERIRNEHQFTDDMEVTLGLHVIEYYAFARSPEDFGPDAPNANRRKQLLTLANDLLLLDLLELTRSFQAGFEQPADVNFPATETQLLRKMHRKSQEILSEYNRLGAHSQFSQASLRNIEVQLRLLRELLQAPISTNHFLLELDTELTETLNQTLEEAIQLVSEGNPMDDARGILLVSSISHQFDDLIRRLPIQR